MMICVNYKAGWATFNKNVIKAQHANARCLEDPSELTELSSYRKILFFREPKERFVSYLNDKVLLMRGDKEATFRHVSKLAPPSFIDAFRSSSVSEKKELLSEFLIFLSPFIHHDGHTMPQHQPLLRYGLELTYFDEVLSFEKNLMVINQIYGTNHEKISNVTAFKDLAFSSSLAEQIDHFCQVWYAYDYVLFNAVS